MERAQSQRRWERYDVTVRTKITWSLNGEAQSISGEASDVSQGGLRMFIPRDLSLGVTLLLEFSLPYNSRVMAIRGVIRGRHGFTYGIEFISPSDYQQRAIAQLCKTLQLLR